jgi:purine-binding chemotaxis protein CheW
MPSPAPDLTFVRQEEQLVAFRLAGETYGIPIMQVHEIIRNCEITRVPRSLPHVRGVVNLRGNVVPVIDLRIRLGLPPIEPGPEGRIIVVDIGTGIAGLIVDAVSQVIRIPAEQIEQPCSMIRNSDADLTLGVGRLEDELVIILDVARALQNER